MIDTFMERVRMLHQHAALQYIRSHVLTYIVGLFVISRLLYVGIGDVAVRVLNQDVPAAKTAYSRQISTLLPIQMWYTWDSVHYGNLAAEYDLSLGRLAPTDTVGNVKTYYLLHWFPLYPWIVKIISVVTFVSIPYVQLLLNNALFIAALYLLYRLLRHDEDDTFGRQALAFFILLPTSFIFSAGMTEALFLFLSLASLVAARQRRWPLAGLLGGLLALTRSEGFLIALPLLFEALQQYGRPTKQWRLYIRPLIACLLCGSGLGLFLLYSWVRTGTPLAYVDSQTVGSAITVHNPLLYLLENVLKLRSLIILAEVGLVAIIWRKLRWSYLVYAAIFTAVALSVADSAVASSLRYVSFIFPVGIAAAYLGQYRQWAAQYLWVGLGIIHGGLFILWVCWWTGFII